MKGFIITTDKETADKIERFFKSSAWTDYRTIALGGITHNPDYSDVHVIPSSEEKSIRLSDIFWLGYHIQY